MPIYMRFKDFSGSKGRFREVIKLQAVKLPKPWAETAPNRLILLDPGSMPWAAQPKEAENRVEIP